MADYAGIQESMGVIPHHFLLARLRGLAQFLQVDMKLLIQSEEFPELALVLGKKDLLPRLFNSFPGFGWLQARVPMKGVPRTPTHRMSGINFLIFIQALPIYRPGWPFKG